MTSTRTASSPTTSTTAAGMTVTRTTYTPASDPPPSIDAIEPGMKRGAAGAEVTTVQTALARFFPAHVTGTFDASTEKQLKQLQKDHGLPATGVADATTLEVLGRSSSAVAFDAVTVTESSKESSFVRSTQTTLPGGIIATRSTITPGSPALSDVAPGNEKGAVGPEVQTIQKRLESWGFTVSVNSVFDAQTEKAVKAFQREMGLPSNGQVDAATLEALAYEPGDGLAQAQALAGPASDALATAADQQAKENEAAKRAAGEKPEGHCAAHVNAALQRAGMPKGGGNAHTYGASLPARADMVEIRGLSVAELGQLPPGAIIVYGKSANKEWGHVTIVSHDQTEIGQRLESSDHQQKLSDVAGSSKYGTTFGDEHGGPRFRVFMPVAPAEAPSPASP